MTPPVRVPLKLDVVFLLFVMGLLRRDLHYYLPAPLPLTLRNVSLRARFRDVTPSPPYAHWVFSPTLRLSPCSTSSSVSLPAHHIQENSPQKTKYNWSLITLRYFPKFVVHHINSISLSQLVYTQNFSNGSDVTLFVKPLLWSFSRWTLKSLMKTLLIR